MQLRSLLPYLLLIAVSVGVFHRTLHSPFIFDDAIAIRDNPTIKRLTDLSSVLSPPNNGSGVTGRPMVNLSLAINHAIGGLEPRGYHLTNVVAHGIAGALLLGCLRRLLPRCGVQRANRAAFLVSLLWTLHPLQTESVASVIQRTEILAGIFLLSVLFCLLASLDSPRPGRWYFVGTACCVLGMATKEIMFVAPILVLLIDRALIAGTFSAAWRCRRGFYLGLAASWLVLAVLVAWMGGTRGAAAGFGTGGIPWWAYFLKQWEAITTYLRLCFWPDPLIVDYGWDVVTNPRPVILEGLLLSGLGVMTVIGLQRNRPWALLGAWFFLILGPSSSVMPLAAQTMAEHRMYLPLAAVLVPVVLLILRLPGRWGTPAVFTVALSLGVVSYARTADYDSELKLWTKTVADRPGNERAHYNLGTLLKSAGRPEEALVHFHRAVELRPRYLPPRVSIANHHFRAGRPTQAIAEYEAVLAIDPGFQEALGNLGALLCEKGDLESGMALLLRAVALYPDFADAHFNLATISHKSGQLPSAEKHYREAIRLQPTRAEAWNNLGVLLLNQGRLSEAEANFRRALELKPDYPQARDNLQAAMAAGR